MSHITVYHPHYDILAMLVKSCSFPFYEQHLANGPFKLIKFTAFLEAIDSCN